jgi:hypothetical protein
MYREDPGGLSPSLPDEEIWKRVPDALIAL